MMPLVRKFCATKQKTIIGRCFSTKEALVFLKERGYSKGLSKGIVHSLLQPGTGISETSVFDTVVTLAGAYEIGEDAGLVPLAKTVEIELAIQRGKSDVYFNFKLPDSKGYLLCKGLEGMNLKDVIEFGRSENSEVLGEYLECSCSGIMACSTCHIYISSEWYNKVNSVCPLTEAETDMIDLAFEPKSTSRLGCQIKLHKSIDGFEFEVPKDALNLFDHIPFKD